MTHLRSVGRRHDLPPLWDDHVVVWNEWRTEPWTTAGFHTPLRDQACRECGNLGPGKTTHGAVAHDETTTRAQIEGAQLARKGGRYAYIRLFAHRCDCGLDTVHDMETDEWFTLDETDYGDAGSVHPDRVQGSLF